MTVAQAGETEKTTPSSELRLTDADVAKLEGGQYKAALLWRTSSDFVNALTAGATDEFIGRE
jgi:ribose transport system substrate-binding protein